MSSLSQDLEVTLQSLDRDRARYLESLVRDAMALAKATPSPPGADSGWPLGYFDATAGAMAEEVFERPAQGDLTQREPGDAVLVPSPSRLATQKPWLAPKRLIAFVPANCQLPTANCQLPTDYYPLVLSPLTCPLAPRKR
jgi:hypothetical protein